MLLRKLLRAQIRRLAEGDAPQLSPLRSNGTIPTYCHDTVVPIPPIEGLDDDELVARVGWEITKIVVEGEHHSRADRHEVVRKQIRQLARIFHR